MMCIIRKFVKKIIQYKHVLLKLFIATIFGCCLALYILIYLEFDKSLLKKDKYHDLKETYIINTPGCKILRKMDLEINKHSIKDYQTRETFKKCSDKQPITYHVHDFGGKEKILRDKLAALQYGKFGNETIFCSCAPEDFKYDVHKSGTWPISSQLLKKECEIDDTNAIYTTSCWYVNETTGLDEHVYSDVYVVMRNYIKNYNEIHTNQNIHITNNKTMGISQQRYSVVLVAIDSLIGYHAEYTIPKTFRKMTSDPGWVQFPGYHEVNDAFSFIIDNVNDRNETSILKEIAEKGYISVYANDKAKEDFSEWGDFQYSNAPYFNAVREELHLRNRPKPLKPCLGASTLFERLLKFSKDILIKHDEQPMFMILRTSVLTGEDSTTASPFDDHLNDFLNVFNYDRTFLILFGTNDHYLSRTKQSTLLPGLFIRIPDHFQFFFRHETSNMIEQSNTLTNVFELYMTVQRLISSHVPSIYCENCTSLFNFPKMNKSCQSIDITNCACTK